MPTMTTCALFRATHSFTQHAYLLTPSNSTWSDPEDQYPHTFSWPNLGLPLVTRSTRHIKYFGDGPYNATIMGLD